MLNKTYITTEDRKYFSRIIIFYPMASLISWTPGYLFNMLEIFKVDKFTVDTPENKDF